MGNTITLRYNVGGVYTIEFIPPIITTTTKPTILTSITPLTNITSPIPTTTSEVAPSTTTPTYTITTSEVTVSPAIRGGPLEYLVLSIVALAIVIAFVAYIFKKRHSGSVSVEVSPVEVLDDRDKLILNALKSSSLNISELSRALGLSKSTIWRRVKKLESRGYVRTRSSGKTVIVEITERGLKVLG